MMVVATDGRSPRTRRASRYAYRTHFVVRTSRQNRAINRMRFDVVETSARMSSTPPATEVGWDAGTRDEDGGRRLGVGVGYRGHKIPPPPTPPPASGRQIVLRPSAGGSASPRGRLTGRPGHGRGRGGRGRHVVVRRRRRGRQRVRRPGRDHFGLGRVHAAVTALRVLQRRVVVALAQKLGPGRGLRRTLGSAGRRAAADARRGRRVRRFRRRHRVVLFPLGPPILKPYLHLLTTREIVSTHTRIIM